MGSHGTKPSSFVFFSPEEVAALTEGEQYRYLNAAVAEIERLQQLWETHDKALNEQLARLRPAGAVRR
jgi:hypothetical protein